MAKPVTVNDVLDGQVALDLECLDRIYLNGWVNNLQVGGQVVSFLTAHLGYPIPSPAIFDKIGTAFRRAVTRFAEQDHIPVVRFTKADRKIDRMRPYLAAQARTGRSGVAAIGIAQEYASAFTGTKREGSTGAPWFAFHKADRRVTCYYFYLWDVDFGPAFIKICAYFPYPTKICLLTELGDRSSQVRGRMPVRLARVRAHDRTGRAVTGSERIVGWTGRRAAGDRGSVRALPAA